MRMAPPVFISGQPDCARCGRLASKCLSCWRFLLRVVSHTLTDMDVAVKPGGWQQATMDRPITMPWWRRPHWRQVLVAGAAGLLAVLAVVAFIGPAQRSLRMSLAGASIA